MTTQIALTAALLCLLAGACCAQGLEEGLVAHWTFDEGEGDVARDVTGNGHDATIRGATFVPSPRGHALRFTTREDLARYGRLEDMILSGDMTLAVWVKTDSSVESGTNRLLFGDTGMGVERNLNLRMDGYGNIRFEWADGTANASLLAPAELLDGTWKHVVVVADSEAREAVMYVDGESVARMRMPLPISPAPIRERITGWFYNGYFQGELDDIRLYSRALPEPQVRELFSSQAAVQVGRSRMLLDISSDPPRGVLSATLRNWTDETRRVEVALHPKGAEQEPAETHSFALAPGGEVEVGLGHVELAPLFTRRADLYLVTQPAAAGRMIVSTAYEDLTDVQELQAAAWLYVEALRLQVQDPWRPDTPPVKTPEVTLDVHAAVPLEQLARAVLTVTLTSRETGQVAATRRVEGPQPTTRVTFDTADLPWGAYDVRVALTDETGREAASTEGLATVLPGGEQRIEVVNNLTSELMNAGERGLLERGEIAFMNPRDGWCWFSVEGEAQVRLHGEEGNLAVAVEGEGPAEAMRLLPAGRHELSVTGAPTGLLVRAIPGLFHNVYPTGPRIAPFGRHTWERLSRFTLRNTNMIESHQVDLPEAEEWISLGKSWIMNRRAPGLLDDRDWTPQDLMEYWRETTGFGTERMSGMQLDEYLPRMGGDLFVNTARSLAMLAEAPDFEGKMWIPFVVRVWGNQPMEVFMKTVLAAGWPFSTEVYVGEMPTEQEARRLIETAFLADAYGWESAYPGSMRRAIFAPMYAYLPWCTTNRCPQADFRAHLDIQMHMLATHPAFFGLWGVQPYRANYVDEEILNVTALMLRHYCIEGHTEPFIEDPYELRHVADPDFEEGLAHWEVTPAEEDNITHGTFRGYGTLQGRYPSARYGDTFLLTRRSAQGPNVFSQEMRNLEAGRLYSLKMKTGDYDDLTGGVSRRTDAAVSITIDGAEVLEGGFQWPFESVRGPAPFSREHRFWMNYHWLQFRATGPTARLTVTDWESEEEPGGPEGQRLMFNFVEVQPVFETQ